MTDSIETRVARGVALLDEKLPGWVDRIDLGKLDLDSPCNCILGQEFAGHPQTERWSPYDVGVSELRGDPEYGFAAHHGFDARGDMALSQLGGEYGALTAEWRRVILARRGGAS